MNQRAFSRQPLHHPAQVSSPRHESLPCIIEDFCKGGLMLTYEYQASDLLSSDATPFQQNELCYVDFRSSTLGIQYRLETRIARVMDGALGLMITQSHPEAIHALYQLAKKYVPDDKPVPQADKQQQHESEPTISLTPYREAIAHYLGEHSDNLFARIKDTLLLELSNAANTEEKARTKGIIQQLNRQQSEIEQRFSGHALEHFDQWLNGEGELDNPTDNTVDQPDSSIHDLNEWFALRVAAAKAEKIHALALTQLASILSAAGAPDAPLPFGPTAISHAFYLTLQPLQLTHQQLKTLFNVFNEEVVTELDTLYDALLQLSGAEQTKTQSVTPEPLAPTPQPTVTKLKQPVREAELTAGPAYPSATDRELSSLLRVLLAEITANQISPDPLLSIVSSLLSKQELDLSQNQTQLFDDVQQLTLLLKKQSTLGAILESATTQLELVIVISLLEDNGFSADNSHPLRVAINGLLNLAPLAPSTNKATEKNILHLLTAIAKQYCENEPDLTSCNQDINRLLLQQRETAQRNINRLIESCEGLQAIEQAKARVAQIITSSIHGDQVCQALAELLQHGWRDLMVLTALREEPDSANWIGYTRVIRALGRIQPDTAPEKLQQLLRSPLFKVIETGAQQSAMGKTQIQNLLPKIRSLLESPQDSPFIKTDLSSLSPDTPADQTTSPELAPWLEQAKQLTPGDWLAQENQSLLQLAWIGEEHYRFTLVNPQGMKIADYSLVEMAEALQQGLLTPQPEQGESIIDLWIAQMTPRNDLECESLSA